MPVLSTLPAVQRNKLLMRPVQLNDATPWTPLAKPLSEATLAVVTTAGLHLRSDRPFIRYDRTFRVIPSDAAEADILQSQSSIGFDRSLRMRDLNVVFPLDRLRELRDQQFIGSLADDFFSMVGAQDNSEGAAENVGTALAPRLKEQGVDVVLITPTCPFCTHTGGALQRVLEAAGLTTVSISLVREFTEKIKPPRALFVPFPFGAPCGPPGDKSTQTDVVKSALSLTDAAEGPVLADFGGSGEVGLSPAPLQASDVGRRAATDMDAAMETSMMRRYYEQWLEHENKTAVGLTGVPPTRFRGLVRFLQSLLSGDADMRERPSSTPLSDWIRYCADDLKAMYLEGRMVMKPGESDDDTARWFWGETALGALLQDVSRQLAQSPDESLQQAAYGVAR